MVISEAFELYDEEELAANNRSQKTRTNYRTCMRSLLKSTLDIPIELLTKQHILRWKMDREALGQSDATISHDLSRVKNVLRYLRREGYKVLDEDNIKLPRLKEKTYTWLPHDEVKRLLAVINNPRDKAIVACLWSTGCRISELLNLNREDVRGNTAQIMGKGDRPGVVYFDEQAMEYLGQYLAARKDTLRPLFISSQHRRITNSRFSQVLHDYADAAGIDKNVTPHVLRHSFATDLKLNGADIFDIQKQLRHKRISSTQIYVHQNDQERIEKYQRFHSV